MWLTVVDDEDMEQWRTDAETEKWNDAARTNSDKNQWIRFDLWTANRRWRDDASWLSMTETDTRTPVQSGPMYTWTPAGDDSYIQL